MSKVDYKEHQALFEALLIKRKKLTVSQYCEEAGLNYATARRHLKKPKVNSPRPEKKAATAKSKLDKPRTPAQQAWVDLLTEFLARATVNPAFKMAEFAKEKGKPPASVRRQFNEMRKDAEFGSIFDQYDAQCVKLSEMASEKKDKPRGKSKGAAKGVKAAQPDRSRKNDQSRGQQMRKNAQKEPDHTAQSDRFDHEIAQVATLEGFVKRGKLRTETLREKPTITIHGGYCRNAAVVESLIDTLAEIDPLSVSNELMIARAQYLSMNESINARLAKYDQWEMDAIESGTPVQVGGEDADLDAMRDRLLFGYAPRLRELEASIRFMVDLENKRALELRKAKIEEMKLPMHLPAEETQLVIQVLELRERNGWDAITTAQNIERLGAKVPPALMLEVGEEFGYEDPDDDSLGSHSLDELNAITDEYLSKKEKYINEELPAKRQAVADAIEEAELRETGQEVSPHALTKEAKDEERWNDYDELDGGSLHGEG